ncbi:YxiG-like protein [Actinocorallia lasiicapitis]
MDVAVLERALEDVFDQGVVFHGFVDYMRDYEVIIHATADPGTGLPPANLRYLFRHCVEVRCRTAVQPDIWKSSLDDRLVDDEPGQDPDGYVWGVKWHALYPGATLVRDSPTAAAWSEAIGIDFHEVRVRTNAHDLTLAFSDLQVSEPAPGYTPFVVDD